MSIILFMVAGAAAIHTVQFDHRGVPVEAVYSARTDIRMQTVGAHTPNRMDGRRCRWTATVLVERRLTSGPALAQTLPGDRRFSGNLPGPCPSETTGIDREVARHDTQIRDHVVAVAAKDRAPLLAELNAVHSMASN